MRRFSWLDAGLLLMFVAAVLTAIYVNVDDRSRLSEIHDLQKFGRIEAFTINYAESEWIVFRDSYGLQVFKKERDQ